MVMSRPCLSDPNGVVAREKGRIERALWRMAKAATPLGLMEFRGIGPWVGLRASGQPRAL
jgi:hypothetical protein